MKFVLGFITGFTVYFLIVQILSEHNDMYYDGFEAGKLYIRNAMLQQNDSILGCSSLGYIPDTISVKSELKNGGSHKIKGKGLR